jgi:hypothetical protein
MGIAVSAERIQLQAFQIAREFNINNFKASKKWLDAFKKRNK